MKRVTDLTSWLAALDEARLARVLSRRPDATAGSIPRNLSELAQRLCHPDSVAAVLDAAPTPLRQVSEALVALGTPAPRPGCGICWYAPSRTTMAR